MNQPPSRFSLNPSPLTGVRSRECGGTQNVSVWPSKPRVSLLQISRPNHEMPHGDSTSCIREISALGGVPTHQTGRPRHEVRNRKTTGMCIIMVFNCCFIFYCKSNGHCSYGPSKQHWLPFIWQSASAGRNTPAGLQPFYARRRWRENTSRLLDLGD